MRGVSVPVAPIILEESEIDAWLAEERARALATPTCPECGAFGDKNVRDELTYCCQTCGAGDTALEE
jgi:hypothetical protein